METQHAVATTCIIDPTHSEVQFKVKHLMVSTVTGLFSRYEGKMQMDSDNFENARITFSADIDSISTGNAQRDEHLKSEEFFDAVQHPTLSFGSISIIRTRADTYRVNSQLTLHGITKPVLLKA